MATATPSASEPFHDTSHPSVTTAGRWLFLAGILLMVTGDGPPWTIRISKWPTPFPFLAWPWLYPVLLALGAACFAAGGGVKSWRLPHLRFVVIPLAAVLGAFLLSAAASQAHVLSAIAFFSVACIIGTCWIVAALLEDDRLYRAIWPVIAVALLLLAVRVILWRLDEGLNLVAFQVLNNAWIGKLQLAWVFNLFAPMLVARAMAEPRRRMAVLYGLTWGVTGAATYLLFSRMGSIVFAVSTIGVCIFNPGQWRKVLLILIAGAAIAAGLVATSNRMSRHVVSTILNPDRNPGVNIRLNVWRDALRLFRSNPITGVGLGAYDEVAYSLDGTTAGPEFRRNGWHAHNVYLHVLAESGVVGLLAWCYFWSAIISRLLGSWRRAETRARLAAAGAVWAVFAFLTLSMTEVLIGARVTASLRMNLTIGLVVVLGLHAAKQASRTGSQPV
jgi:hypothetical protein